MKKTVSFVSASTSILGAIGLLVSYVPSASAKITDQHVWEAHPPIHIKGNATSTYQSGYQPAQIKTAYGVNQLSYDGTGQTIAIVDAYGSPTIQNDVRSEERRVG